LKHSFVDKYSDGHSLIHHLDPRVKLIFTILFILVVIVTPPERWWAFLSCFLILLIMVGLSRVPVIYIMKRSLLVLPFIIVVAISVPFFRGGEIIGSYSLGVFSVSVTNTGLRIFTGVLTKAWLSAVSLIVLTATTPINSLFKALNQMRFPKILIMILSFMYRYIFVLYDELLRMKQARDSRYLGIGIWQNIKTAGSMIGILFVRSYERGERIYASMLSRGYDGTPHILSELRLSKVDLTFVCLSGLYLLSIGIIANII